MKLPKHVQFWDDERGDGNGIIVTLHYGWSFEHSQHTGVMGFDTLREARDAIKLKNVERCTCKECKKATGA